MQHAAQALDRFPMHAGFPSPAIPARQQPAPFPVSPERHGLSGNGSPREAVDPQPIDMQCLAQYRAPLLRFATLMLRNQAEAEDVVQDTLLVALQSAKSFAGRSSVKTWLVGILKHKINDAFRRASRHVPLHDADDFEVPDDMNLQLTGQVNWQPSLSHWSDPEAALSHRKFFELLERCIASLPKNTAQAFVMREVMGMETGQICAALGITRNNCFVMLYRARTKLRAQLEQLGFGGDASGRGMTSAVTPAG